MLIFLKHVPNFRAGMELSWELLDQWRILNKSISDGWIIKVKHGWSMQGKSESYYD